MKKLNIYCTAGFPELDSTREVMKVIQDAGADIIELGIPYSDPVADGPVIEAAGKKALDSGMSIPLLFSQIENMRQEITIPVYLMGYFNPVLQFGMEKFVEKAASIGVTGLIIPDLPPAIFEKQYAALFKKNNLHFVCLITPETTDDRIRYLDAISSGFLYAVSSSSTTGKNKDLQSQEAYFQRLQQLGLKNEILVGFGISDKTSFDYVSGFVDGGIIGSAFVKCIQGNENWQNAARNFISSIKN